MKLKHVMICLMPVLVGACSTGYSTATNAVTGQSRIYAMGTDAALHIAHDAIAQSFPDRPIDPITDPVQGYAAHTGSGLNGSTQEVVIHPVTGVTTSGASVDGYTFDVSGHGTISGSNFDTASIYAQLQQSLDATGNGIDVVQITPRTKPP